MTAVPLTADTSGHDAKFKLSLPGSGKILSRSKLVITLHPLCIVFCLYFNNHYTLHDCVYNAEDAKLLVLRHYLISNYPEC
jgi:hypothetical protein